MKRLLFLTSLLCTSPIFSMLSPYGPLIEKDGELIHAGLIQKEEEKQVPVKKHAVEEIIKVAIVNDKVEWLALLDLSISRNKDNSVFRRLLTHPDEQGATPILLACQLGQEKIVKFILGIHEAEASRKFFIKVPNGDEVPCTPLHMAAAKGHTDIVKLLLGAGAEVKSEFAPKKRTPLHYAIANGHVGVVKLLRKVDADLYIWDEDKNTPVSLAVNREYDQNLTEALNLDEHLIHAAMNGWISYFSDLFTLKANLEVVDDTYKATPLMWAANYGYTKAVQLLLDAKANIHAKNKDGLTALDCARKKNHLDVAAILEEALKKSSAFDDKGKEER